MAAGLGFKDFVTGEVLTAADVDGYLMQGVWVFASAAARDAAVTSPQEGNFAYLKDTNVTTYYTGSAWANLDTTGMTNPMTTTGDTIYSSPGSTPVRLGIGSTGQVLTVAGGVPSWATPAGASFIGVQATKTTDQSCANATDTQISFNSENFDTDGFHDNTTNNERLTVPAGLGGYYKVYFSMIWANNATVARRIVEVYKNGGKSTGTFVQLFETSSINVPTCLSSFTINLSAGDWLQINAVQLTGGALDFRAFTSMFGMEKIG